MRVYVNTSFNRDRARTQRHVPPIPPKFEHIWHNRMRIKDAHQLQQNSKSQLGPDFFPLRPWDQPATFVLFHNFKRLVNQLLHKTWHFRPHLVSALLAVDRDGPKRTGHYVLFKTDFTWVFYFNKLSFSCDLNGYVFHNRRSILEFQVVVVYWLFASACPCWLVNQSFLFCLFVRQFAEAIALLVVLCV